MGADIVFKASRWKALFLVVVSGLFLLPGWSMFGKHPVIAILGMLLFGAGVFFGMVMLVAGGELRLDDQGLTLKGLFKTKSYPWDSIQSIEALRVSPQRMIVLTYWPAGTRRVAGRAPPVKTATLGNAYNTSFDNLLETLQDWHVRHGPDIEGKAAPIPAPVPAARAPADPATASLLRAVAEQRKADPLIGAKLGGKELTQKLIAAFKTDKGVHVESLLCALGALAGYACQASVRAEFAKLKGGPDSKAFMVVTGADGKKYFFGDEVNKPLAEGKYSVWALAAGTAQHLGSRDLIDLNAVFAHVAATVGGAGFGIPRIPEGHRPGDLPAHYVKNLWPQALPTVRQFCEQPYEWPILFSCAIQEVLEMGKGVIDPTLGLTIVMESAVPMSKVDFDAL